MSIVIYATFYHRASQFPHIEQIVSGLEPGTTLHVITSKEASVKLKETIMERNGRLLSNEIMCNHYVDEGYIKYRDVNIGIMTPSDESELIRDIREEFRKSTSDEDIDSVILDVDMTFAQPWESVAVCKLSATLNVRMYTEHGSSRRTIASFPRLVSLDDKELAVMDGKLRSSGFTVTDAVDDLRRNGSSSSYSTTQRVVRSLADKGFIRELRDKKYPGPRSNHGGNREKYYSVVDEGWMMYRLNRRTVKNIKDSWRDTISDSGDDQDSG